MATDISPWIVTMMISDDDNLGSTATNTNFDANADTDTIFMEKMRTRI